MSHIVVMAMEMPWSLFVLAALLSVDAAHSHKGSQGLSCVNDFVNNVNCTWTGSPVAPGANCLISGVKRMWVSVNNVRLPSQMIRTCKLEQHGGSPPGCSFTFENKVFNPFKDMPYISMECDGMLVENLTNYEPKSHIKMHPPGVPSVNSTANETWISWSAGSPRSKFIKSVDFQVQIKQKKQTWKEATVLSTKDLKLRLPSWQLRGHCEVRVRVYPTDRPNSHWSDWSPATSWEGAADMETSQNKEWPLDQTSVVTCGVMFSLGLIFVMLVLCRICGNKGLMVPGCCSPLHKEKSVPNPSKYFHTLHSVHGGNLKKWLNPLSAPESFFTVQPREYISTVEFCKSSDVAPSTSPSSSSTCALLHSKSCSSASSDTSGIADNSSSSSSGFSNMGYFLSSSSSSSARTNPNPAYFTYQDDFHNLHSSHNLHLSLRPSITTFPSYESLKREPQSPDSGFGIGEEDEEDKRDKKAVGVEGEEVSKDHQTCPLLILPLHHPSQICPPFSPPPPPNVPSLTHDSQQVDTPVVDASGSYAAWPLTGAVCRSSSMPVEPCKTGYLTLKELQTTFSNKSI
ncbi:interleukin-2 receptor subunit beta [Chaetodon trifascialis]|uniref:interleukin-2 receptor subunit beta n=1 Tax=Chaetodon trifascialis TaxID=109706 RepID=UPI0039956F52